MQIKTKTPLILLSGLLCDDTVWQKIADNLSEVADVSMMSFRGFDSIEKMAEYVLIHAPASFALAGHSMGGRVALEVFKQAPERIERLALFNTGVHNKRDGEALGRQKLLDIAAKEGMSAVAEAWLPPMMSRDSLDNKLLMTQLKKMVTNYNAEEFSLQIQALLQRPNAETVLPTINVPTLLLSGDEDTWSPVEQHLAMQKMISKSHMVTIEKASHMAPVERPEAVAAALRNWLAL